MSSEKQPTRTLENAQIGSRVTQLRKERSVTLAEAAEVLGLTEHSLKDREVGNRRFSGAEIYKLATLLDVLPSWILGSIELNALDDPF